MTHARDIALALDTRLRGIAPAAGYRTPMGERVYRGRRRLNEEHIPCIVLIESDDEPQDHRPGRVKLAQRYLIEGHTPCDPDNPNDAAHDILSDLKRAIFAGDDTLGGLVRTLKYLGRSIEPREDGLSLVSASIEIEVDYIEDLSNP